MVQIRSVRFLDRHRVKREAHVDDHSGFFPSQALYILEDILALPRLEHTLALDTVQLCVRFSILDTLRVDLDPGDALEMGGEGDAKQSGSTVRIHQMGRRRVRRWGEGGRGWREDGVPDVFSQRDQDRVVVLEEGTRGEGEVEVSDSLMDSF